MSVMLDVVSCLLLLGGGVFSVVGGVGIIRFPEFFSRLHGGGITDTMGAGLILLGLLFQSGLSLISLKLLMILFFLMVASPSSCHALAKAALTSGMKPVLDDTTKSKSAEVS